MNASHPHSSASTLVETVSVSLALSTYTSQDAASFDKLRAQPNPQSIYPGSDVYTGSQTINDILMVSTSNQPIFTVHIATLTVCIILIATVVFMGCIGNGAVIVQVITNWNSRYGYAPLILNLAVSDFLICSCLAPVFLIFLCRSPPTPNIFCGLFTFMGTICTLSSLLTMTAIALHRYRLMSTSVIQRHLGISISMATLVIIWTIGFVVALAGILYVSSNWNDPFQNCGIVNVSGKANEKLSEFAISFLAPVCALGFLCTVASCLVVVWVARLPTCWKNAYDFYNAEVASSEKRPKISEVISIAFKQLIGCFTVIDKETRILYFVAILVASLCWAPILIAHVLTLMMGESLVLYQLKLCGIALVFLNSALHPYIYTEHGWRFRNRYKVCLHAAFDCRRADQWSIGSSTGQTTTGTDVEQPIVTVVGTCTEKEKPTSKQNEIRSLMAMTVSGTMFETHICECSKACRCTNLINGTRGSSGTSRNLSNINTRNKKMNAVFVEEVEDDDTLDSGIDRDALSEVDGLYNDVEASRNLLVTTGKKICFVTKVNNEIERPSNHRGSLDSLTLTEMSSEASLYSADAAENLTVTLPPRNSTPAGPATGVVGSLGKSGGAKNTRHSSLSSWPTAPLQRPHHQPNITSPALERQRYHYHHLHHHHHVILYPNNRECVRTSEAVSLPAPTCHAAARKDDNEPPTNAEKEEVVADRRKETDEEVEVKEEERRSAEINKENDVLFAQLDSSSAFCREVAAFSTSGNKAADFLLCLLNREREDSPDFSSSSLGLSTGSSSTHESLPQKPRLKTLSSPSSCTCLSSTQAPFSSTVAEQPDIDLTATQTPLICPSNHKLPSRCQHLRPRIKGSEHWHTDYDDGVLVTEHSYPRCQHPGSQTLYTQEDFCKFYPLQRMHDKTLSNFNSHHTQTNRHEKQKTERFVRQKSDQQHLQSKINR